MPITSRNFGYLKDLADKRDLLASVKFKAMASAPVTYSIREFVVEILDQDGVGSCVAEALCQAIRMVDKRNYPNTVPALTSRWWTYWHARNQNGWAKIDSGTYPRTAIKVLNLLGRPPESAWPHIVSDAASDHPTWAKKPPPDVNIAAIDKRKASYVRIDAAGTGRIEPIRQSISAKKPVIFGTAVGYSFLESRGQTTNIQPPKNEGIAGGHAMVGVAYDATGLWVANSWTANWRDRGFAHLSWSYLAWESTGDLWSIDLPAV